MGEKTTLSGTCYLFLGDDPLRGVLAFQMWLLYGSARESAMLATHAKRQATPLRGSRDKLHTPNLCFQRGGVVTVERMVLAACVGIRVTVDGEIAFPASASKPCLQR